MKEQLAYYQQLELLVVIRSQLLTAGQRRVDVERGLLQPGRDRHVVAHERRYVAFDEHVAAGEAARILHLRIVALVDHCMAL